MAVNRIFSTRSEESIEEEPASKNRRMLDGRAGRAPTFHPVTSTISGRSTGVPTVVAAGQRKICIKERPPHHPFRPPEHRQKSSVQANGHGVNSRQKISTRSQMKAEKKNA